MAPLTLLLLLVVMVGTAFLSGIFGMAGGLVLIAVVAGYYVAYGSYLLVVAP